MTREFFFEGVKPPCDEALCVRLDAAARRLASKLRALDVSTVGLSPYNSGYLRGYLGALRPALQRYTHLLAVGLSVCGRPVDESVCLDYGGGTGLLAMLAKEAGVGTVLYSDIYDVSCRDAARLGQAVGAVAEHYIVGDVDEVVGFVDERRVRCDVVACYDVLEHIYNLTAFFRRLPGILSDDGVMVFASSANGSNPLVRRRLVAKARRFEYQDRPVAPDGKERDSSQSFLAIRRRIIREYAPRLTEKETESLAVRTRGLARPDIDRAVDAYRASGTLPPPAARGSNTCDPLTGNWAEHLISPRELRWLLRDVNLRGKVLRGYYGSWVGPKAFMFPLMNRLIRVLGPFGVCLAPFYVFLAGKRRMTEGDQTGQA